MKALVIGAGSIGLRHAKILQEMGLEVNFFSSRSDLKFPKINILSKKNLIDFDYLIISNESSKHYKTLKKILQLVSNKIILVENPLFIKRSHHDLQTFNNKCYVGYNLRYHPLVKMVKEAILNDKIISIELNCSQYLPDWNPWRDYRNTYSAKKSLGGGVLKDITHEIDLLYYFLGSCKPEFLSSNYLKLSKLEIETNDFYRSNGFFGKVFFSVSLDYISKITRRHIIIYSDTKTIYANLLSGKFIISSDLNEEHHNFKTDLDLTYEKMHKDILYNQGKSACDYDTGKEITQWFQD